MASPDVLSAVRELSAPLVRAKTTLPDFEGNVVTFVSDVLDKHLSAHSETRKREERNHRAFTGIGNGQWPTELLNRIKESGESRDLSQYNLMFKKIVTSIGAMFANPHDISYEPIDGNSNVTDLMMVAKRLVMSDKQLMSWAPEIMDFYKDAHICRGYGMLTIDTSKHFLGNIAFRHVKAGHFSPDPAWSGRSLATCRHAVMVSYMTPSDMKKKYKTKSPRIEQMVRNQALTKTFETNPDAVAPEQWALDAVRGDEYRVIHYIHMVNEPRTRRLAIDFYGKPIDIPNPPEELTDPLKNAWLQEWYKTNGISEADVIEHDEHVEVCYVVSVCPDLDPTEPLEDRPADIQVGRLPFVNLSYMRHDGVDVGMVDLMYDPQTSFNQRMSLISEIIARSSKGGKIFEPNAFGNNQAKIAQVKREMSKPGFVIDAEAGFIEGGGRVFAEIPETPYPQLEQQNAAAMSGLIDSVTMVTPAVEGTNESSHETGVLFERKREQGLIGMAMMNEDVSRVWTEVGEMYLEIAKSLYSGVYRDFKIGDKLIEINRPEASPDGVEYLANDVSKLPRCQTVVTLSGDGVTQRVNDRVMSIELVRILPPEFIASKSVLVKRAIGTLDNMTVAQRDEIMALMDKEMEAVTSSIEANIANSKATALQAEMMIQQIQGQMQQAQQPQQEQVPEGAIDQSQVNAEAGNMMAMLDAEAAGGGVPPQSEAVRTPAEMGV